MAKRMRYIGKEGRFCKVGMELEIVDQYEYEDCKDYGFLVKAVEPPYFYVTVFPEDVEEIE